MEGETKLQHYWPTTFFFTPHRVHHFSKHHMEEVNNTMVKKDGGRNSPSDVCMNVDGEKDLGLWM